MGGKYLISVSGEWPLGAIICDLWLTLDYTMCTSSCLSILVICVDRYWSLAYPISYRQFMSTKVVLALITPTWAIPILLYGIGIFAFHQLGTRDIPEGRCHVHYQDDPFFTIVSTVINYWAIIAIILVLYYKIYKITKFFWRKKKQQRATVASNIQIVTLTNNAKNQNDTSSDSDEENYHHSKTKKETEASKCLKEKDKSANSGLFLTVPNMNVSNEHDCESSISPATTSTVTTNCSSFMNANHSSSSLVNQSHKTPKSNSKAMRVLTAVLSSFIICWTPYAVFVIIVSFDESVIPSNVYNISYGLCYINSLLNPTLYAYANEVFRRTFWSILRCR